jgi:single-strand DNA-binding protein
MSFLEKSGRRKMTDGLNKVLLLGNIGKDPELRMTNGGTAVLRLSLATSETYLDNNKQRKERTEWHRIVIWGKRAEALGKLLVKGDRIMIEGKLRTTSYEDRDGKKRFTTEVVADNVLLNGTRGQHGGGGGSRQSAQSGGFDGPGESFGPVDDDDIPF